MNKPLIVLALLFGLISCKREQGVTSAGVPIVTPNGDEAYLHASSDFIFSQQALHTFEVSLPEGALAFIDANPTAEEYVECSLTLNGETLSPVGIRYKGSVGAFIGGVENDGLGMLGGAKTATKLSMKIKIDWQGYNDTFYGLRTLQFHSMNLDPSQLHDRLGYWLFKQMGVSAPRSVHCRLVINGEYAGLFSLVEQIDEQFASYHYPNDGGNIYKELWPLFDNGTVPREDRFYQALETNRVEGVSIDIFRSFANKLGSLEAGALRDVVRDRIGPEEIMAY